MGFPDSSVGKESACNAGDPGWFLAQDVSLEKGKATHSSILGLPGGSDSKEFACYVGGLSSIPGLGRSPGEGNGYPLQYSCMENPVDRGAWWATVHGVTESDTTGQVTHTHTHTLVSWLILHEVIFPYFWACFMMDILGFFVLSLSYLVVK